MVILMLMVIYCDPSTAKVKKKLMRSVQISSKSHISSEVISSSNNVNSESSNKKQCEVQMQKIGEQRKCYHLSKHCS